MPAVGFSIEDAKRIAATVRRVEGTPTDLSGERNPAGPGQTTFWAYLVSTDLSGNHWSFLKLVPAARLPNADDPFAPLESERPLFELAKPTFYSGHTAREANGNKAIEGGTVVQMTFIGYDTSEERRPVYVFSHAAAQQGSGLPIHDHRDNLNGGFAFATYHPGTALPQQPWHI